MTQRPTHQARRAKLAEKLRAQRQESASGGQGGPSGASDAALRRSGGAAPSDGESEGNDSDG